MRTEIIVLLSLLSFAVLSMVVYLLGDRGRMVSTDTTGRGGSFFLGFWVRNWFYWFIKPVKSLSLALGLLPLFFNIFSVVCGLVSLWFFAVGNLPLGGWMIFLSGFADVMDGEIARSRGLASKWGAFIDSTLDRFAEFAAFVGMALFYADSRVMIVAVVTALGGSMLVSYTRARGESLGVLCKTGLMQRAERMLLMGFGAILDPTISQALGRDTGFVLGIIICVIAAGTVATSVYRTVWIARELGRAD